MKTTKKQVKPTAKQSKPAVKLTAKPTAKPVKIAAKPTLSKAERSAIARLAAFKAHTHKTFQSERSASERSEAKTAYTQASRDYAKHPRAFSADDYAPAVRLN